ncbi:MAG: hypothetical protein RI990_316 [Planctomycetota bacterium]
MIAACILGSIVVLSDVPPWAVARLEALSPERPAAYIALAEDLMDRADPSDRATRDLARTLAGLSGAIDARSLGRSAALFLLEHSPDGPERVRLDAVARAMDPEPDRRIDRAERAQAAGAMLQAFAAYRRGDAAGARAWIGRSGADALLDAHPSVLAGGATRFRADCDAMRTSGPPPFSPAQAEALHAVIAACSAGGARTWGEALATGGGAPLPEVDLADPGSLFGVDPVKAWWRAGRWVASPR